MKINKYIYILILLQFTSKLYSQVGINTPYPLGTFHVDGANDNTLVPTAAMAANDFLVTPGGKAGIGTVSPQAALHIHTASPGNGFRLADGTQGNGKLLRSLNKDGDVAWTDRISVKVIELDGAGYGGRVDSDMQYVSRKVSLEPGRWLIRTNILLYTKTDGSLDNGFYAKLSWAEYNGISYTVTTDAKYGNTFGGAYAAQFGIALGHTIIENTSSSAKTYYLVTRRPTFFGTYNPGTLWDLLGARNETSIIAFPAN